MVLPNCHKSENLLVVGLIVVFFFLPYLETGHKPTNPPFFTSQLSIL
jgi:hypothetical protein